MNKKVPFIITAILIIFISGILVWRLVITKKTKGLAALQIDSTPTASVFLNGKMVGETKFADKNLEPGEYTIKLVAKEGTGNWTGKITLLSKTEAFINRVLDENENFSSGEVLSLEKIDGNGTEIAVISTPEKSFVKIDAEDKGVSPILIKDASVGEHEILISYPGFKEKSVSIKTVIGHKLIVNVHLAQEEIAEEKTEQEASPSASPSPKPKATATPKPQEKPKEATESAAPEKPYVEILQTPTGWLRVRLGPPDGDKKATDSGNRVNPGDKFPYLDEESGWFKISYDDKEGWVSGEYAKKVE